MRTMSFHKQFLPMRLFVPLTLLVMAGVLAGKAQPPQSNPQPPVAVQESQQTGSPVVVGDKPIFYVRQRVFSFSPEERARAITEKINQLAEGSPDHIRAITTIDAETTTAIASGELVIMTVTE